MKTFTKLFSSLDQTTKTLQKVEALVTYFESASDEDKLWTIAILSHRRPKRTVRTSLLRQWASEAANLPLWLFEESYHIVGDLAETLALVHPNMESKQNSTLTYWINYIQDLEKLSDEKKKLKVLHAWEQMSQTERFIFNKLITGGWRIGVSQKLITRALSKHTSIDQNILSHRLMGNWTPDNTSYNELIEKEHPLDNISRPYPFYLAYAIEKQPMELGSPQDWYAERKWDGIRGQIIFRKSELFVWSRGEDLITDKFPEFENLKNILSEGTVLDGEILPYKDGKPLGFYVLQTRIGRKNITKSILQKAPVVFVAYDILEYNRNDIRNKPLYERRYFLEDLIHSNFPNSVLKLSELVPFKKWNDLIKEREDSRMYLSEGLMLKKKNSAYKVGRVKGDWWKWKIDPLSVDAVLIYAMRGHGRRSNLYTDYTFAVWGKNNELVPFAKAYSGLTDEELRSVDSFVKKNTVEKFGPVRSVVPELVFEIAFEGIAQSTRHKSGIAVRFPRILRWRKDKKVNEANTLEDLRNLLETYEL